MHSKTIPFSTTSLCSSACYSYHLLFHVMYRFTIYVYRPCFPCSVGCYNVMMVIPWDQCQTFSWPVFAAIYLLFNFLPCQCLCVVIDVRVSAVLIRIFTLLPLHATFTTLLCLCVCVHVNFFVFNCIQVKRSDIYIYIYEGFVGRRIKTTKSW